MESTDVTTRVDLAQDERAAVLDLVATASAADGVPPLSEQFLLDLRAGSGVTHLLAYAASGPSSSKPSSSGHRSSTLSGYAQLSAGAAELVVAPGHRRRGTGTALLSALPGDAQVWSHGDLPGASAFAAARGLDVSRELFVLERDLPATEFADPIVLPDGLRVRPFEPGRDEDEWVRVNAAAFAHHPEQGRLTRADLEQRMAQPWFDSAGLLLIVPTPGQGDPDTVAAFHWTKVHPAGAKGEDPVGEVYVVGVDPAYQGRGLGRPLTLLGLRHLAQQGLEHVILYVDGENAAALRVYRTLGFSTLGVDRTYAPARGPECDDDVMTATANVSDRDLPGTEDDPTADAPEDELSSVRSLASAIPAHRPYQPRAANGRFVRADGSDELPPDRFLEREISWLQFNERVLQLAMDEDVPLLERAKFLAIFSNNLDEFFMVRVAGLKRRIVAGLAVRSAAGLEPREVLEQVGEVAQKLVKLQAKVFLESVRPALADEGITIRRWDQLSDADREPLTRLFIDSIFPVLTPLSVDPAHPFPYISGLSLNLAVTLVNPKTGKEHFARIKVPPSLPRLLRVGGDIQDGEYAVRFVPLEDVIAAHLDQLFTGMEVHEHTTFRVTRNEDLEVEEDDAENLLTALEKELTRRRFGPPVRLEVEEDIDDHVLDLIARELQVEPAEVYRLPAPLDLRNLFIVGDIERSDLKYEPFVPLTQADLSPTESSKASDIFAAMRSKDIQLHHPYDSFSTSVQAFIEQAAADPRVLAIKQTLYRTSGDSPIVDALIDAAEAGKQVLAVVEIKARFDEVNNISWARKLEQAGVHVVYGIVGLKTHAKICLVVRQEAEGLVRYCHIGTGNYNPKTARQYEDLGLLTCDPQVGEDLTRLFNQLSGIAPRSRFKRLLVAPRTVRSGLMEQIEAEAERHERSGGGHIVLKVNAIVDEEIIDALYRASQAGVRVDLWVRSICSLRPGVEGLSETVTVRSTLGRFLEHSRIFWFGGGGDPQVYIGSADMMHRNLDRRVEALVRITDPTHLADIESLLRLGADPGSSRWELSGDGRWTRHHRAADGEPFVDVQSAMIEIHARRRRKARRR